MQIGGNKHHRAASKAARVGLTQNKRHRAQVHDSEETRYLQRGNDSTALLIVEVKYTVLSAVTLHHSLCNA